MSTKSTETAQNILASLKNSIDLEFVQNSSIKTKKQASKAISALERARLEFDVLNDLKEQTND